MQQRRPRGYEDAAAAEPPPPPAPPRRRGSASGASSAGCVTALVAWLRVSLVLFLVSAQIQSAKVSDAADTELGGAGYPLTSPNTILVLGSDARTEGLQGAGREQDRPAARARTRSC